ncbi:hypothetical protein OTU49_001240 [Cherax quadricarinatus]|uniref:Shugoshin C-terminal domain-containing protein n=3 Tax=Cherax quadricarinatus TaxID=27406 RepID=A0AAW0XWR0_CHEQU
MRAGAPGQEVEGMDGKEENEVKPVSAMRKMLKKKLERIKMQRCLRQYMAPASPGFDMAAVYELKLQKLKTNNQALAKALSEQKKETQHWYAELISLKGDLQECQEQLLRATDKDFEKAVEFQVEKRLREHCESINSAITTTMENVVMVVEGLTKAKKLAGGVLNSCRNRSSANSSNSLPRPSGSRLPLGPSSNNVSPRQSVVLPMVSGHVLQPAMVAIPKLNIMWSKKIQERTQAREERVVDMTVIGEQSSNIEEEEEEENLFENEEDTLGNAMEGGESSFRAKVNEDSDCLIDLTNEEKESSSPITSQRTRCRKRASVPEADVSESQGKTSESPRKTGTGRRGKISRGTRGAVCRMTRQMPTASRLDSPKENFVENEEKKIAVKSVAVCDEDPLEGSSWWYTDLTANRSTGSSRGRSRGGRRGRIKTGTGSSSWQSSRGELESSTDSENDNLTESSKSSKGASCEDPFPTVTPVIEASANTLDHSYLASPATMLCRLEKLEARAGRRSKARSRGCSQSVDRAKLNETIPEKQKRTLLPSQEVQRNTDEKNDVAKNDLSLNLHLEEIVESDQEPGNISHHQNTLSMPPPPSLPFPSQQVDWMNDNNLTCLHNVSMDITEPISKILARVAADASKEEQNGKEAQMEKRFFKAQSREQSEVEAEVAEKTPFDVSLMDATHVNIPPYSSQRTIEKENLPPQFENHSHTKETPEISVSLRKVSIVLEDVLKSPREAAEKYTPTVSFSETSSCSGNSESVSNGKMRKNHQKSTSESSVKKASVRRKMLRYSLKDKCREEDSEDKEEDELWRPGIKKYKTYKQRRTFSRKAQTKKSLAGRKRSPVIDSETFKKSLGKRMNENDSESTRTTPDISLDEDEISEDLINKENQDNRGAGSVILSKTTESQCITPNTSLTSCYVKVHRTSIKNIKEPIDSPDVSLQLKLDDSQFPLSPITPFKSKKSREKITNIENGIRKALDQSPISDGCQNANTKVQDREQQVESGSDTQEEHLAGEKNRYSPKGMKCITKGKRDGQQLDKQENMMKERDNIHELGQHGEGEQRLEDLFVQQIEHQRQQDKTQEEGQSRALSTVVAAVKSCEDQNKETLEPTVEKYEEPEILFLESPQPRKRRAAVKVTSFKEPSINRKMRRGAGSTVIISSTSSSKKSVRKSTTN